MGNPAGTESGGSRCEDPPRRRNLRLGLSTGALYPLPTDDVPDVAARLGLADLEIMLQTESEYQTPFVRTLRRRCEDARCRVYAIHLWQQLHPLLSEYRRRADDGRERFDRGIAAAAELGASVVVWHGPSRREAGTDGRERTIGLLGELGRSCAAAGLTLAIENVSWCLFASVREVAALAARLPELNATGARVGFAFDPFQAAEADANPFMLLLAMGGAVVDVHLSDRDEGNGGRRHLPPGEGVLPWSALLRAIAGSYDGPLMLEGVAEGQLDRLTRSRDVLADLLAAATVEADPCAGVLPMGIREGIRLFNDRQFYEAHEAIEPEWHAERRPVRRLYQGILQIGVGFLHALRGNHRGAVLLLTDGIAKTAEFVPTCLGIETARLAAEADAVLARLVDLGPERVGEVIADQMPRVHLAPDETSTNNFRSLEPTSTTIFGIE